MAKVNHDGLKQALDEALDDEYKARATYCGVIERFDSVRPFVNIVEAEQRHIDALLPLYAAYGLPVPEDAWAERVVIPESIAAACQAGVEAEIENAGMYDRLLAQTRDYPDVQAVFRQLQRASQENHLPAFRRCVERGAGHGRGESCGGRGRGRGWQAR